MSKSVHWKVRDGMQMHRIETLVRDFEHYPRQRIDYDHVQRMVDAMESGAAFPPIVICRRTKRIVDGVHRHSASERVLGPKGEVACIEKDYKGLEDYFLDCVRYNSEHGLALSSKDRFRVFEIGEKLHISTSATAAALHMTVNAAGKLSVAPIAKAADVRGPSVSVSPRFQPPEPIIEPEIVRESYRPAPSTRPTLPATIERPDTELSAETRMVRRVVNWLENGQVNVDDAPLMVSLRRLAEILEGMELTAA